MGNTALKEKESNKKRVKPGPKPGSLGPKSNRSISLSRDVDSGLLELVEKYYPTMTVSEYIEALILAQINRRKEASKK